jgi:dihydrofolate reductase
LAAADGKNLVVTGGTVPRLCTDAGLVDEIVLHILPVLLGEGIPFYNSPGAKRTEFTLLRAEGMNFHLQVVSPDRRD